TSSSRSATRWSVEYPREYRSELEHHSRGHLDLADDPPIDRGEAAAVRAAEERLARVVEGGRPAPLEPQAHHLSEVDLRPASNADREMGPAARESGGSAEVRGPHPERGEGTDLVPESSGDVGPLDLKVVDVHAR